MIQGVFAVFDSKARVFFSPFYCPSKEVAIRAFKTAANDPESQLCQHSSDFTLFQLGTFNDELGTFELFREHVNLGLAAIYKSKEVGDA